MTLKDKELIKMMLLYDSGELDDKQRADFERQIKSNEDDLGLLSETRKLMRLARSSEEETAVDPAVVDRILSRSVGNRKTAVAGKPRFERKHFMHMWHPALISAAAALLLCVLIIPWSQRDRPESTAAGLSGQQAYPDDMNIDLQLLILNEEVSWALLEYASMADMDKDLDELADELIKLTEVEI